MEILYARPTQSSSCSVSVYFYDIRLTYDYPPARNIDLQGVINSMERLEDRFNQKFGYPYVFLNDEPFNEEFRT